MDSQIYANKVLSNPTHFSQAVSLIKEAYSDPKLKGLCSENWPSNIAVSYGFPEDEYYAEIWTDGMDWQPNYWIIETIHMSSPKALPLLVFDNHSERNKFNDYDFKQMLKAMMHFRRDLVWIQKDPLHYFCDSIWPFLKYTPPESSLEDNKWGMLPVTFKHNSQEEVSFRANLLFLPDIVKNPKKQSFVTRNVL